MLRVSRAAAGCGMWSAMRQRSSASVVADVLVLLLFLLPGMVPLAFGVRQVFVTRAFLAKSAAADGVVVQLDKVAAKSTTGPGRVTIYYPVVRFTAANGRVVQFTRGVGSDPPDYRVGDAVRVHYDPSNPQHATIESLLDLWGWAIALITVGLVLLTIGGAILIIGRDKPAERARGRRPKRAATGETGEPPPSAGHLPARDDLIAGEEVAAAPTHPRTEEAGRPGDRGEQPAPTPGMAPGTSSPPEPGEVVPPWGTAPETPRTGKSRPPR
jgi:Protein of unknown function (DUF3592)